MFFKKRKTKQNTILILELIPIPIPIPILILILLTIIRLIFLIGNVKLSPYLILIITLRLGVNFSYT